VLDKVISGSDPLHQSDNEYDWLGTGMYFWENNPTRALQFAAERKANPLPNSTKIVVPAVLGAILNLGFCLDLIESSSIALVKSAYESLKELMEKANIQMPINRGRIGEDLLRRELDCAVIQTLHTQRMRNEEIPFDSARAIYTEGGEVYPDAGFREKNHIQICIRNPNCIKGYFIPRQFDTAFPKV
jgi:hypothetical protein